MDDIWIISWFNHTACDANPIWKPPTFACSVATCLGPELKSGPGTEQHSTGHAIATAGGQGQRQGTIGSCFSRL